MRILVAAGARPNFVKIAPVMRALKSVSGVEAVLVHTGQHYDYEMSTSFFEEPLLPNPDIFLGVGPASR